MGQFLHILFVSVITSNQPHPDLFCGTPLASVCMRLQRRNSIKKKEHRKLDVPSKLLLLER